VLCCTGGGQAQGEEGEEGEGPSAGDAEKGHTQEGGAQESEEGTHVVK
jgi:hypothetical protein